MWMIDAMCWEQRSQIEMSVKVLYLKLLFLKTVTICCAMLHQSDYQSVFIYHFYDKSFS